MVRQTAGMKASQNAEGKVETTDEDEGGKAHGAGRDAKVGDDPKGSGSERWPDAEDERVEAGLIEAVEKKVSDDQIIGANRPEGEGVDVTSFETGSGIERSGRAVPAEQAKHRGTGINGIGMKFGSGSHQLCQKSSVAIAKDEGLFLIPQMGEKMETATLKTAAKGKVFEPAIRAGYEVEVGMRFHR